MLEVKNLVKCYSTKGGVTVRALDGVSVKFPERGMVFLLGKSGSGKSTLLNVSGGLDQPDSGEVIVKGRSSAEFSAADFDSYRNTYVGFIFQEYNILNEFTVEQNISLALQLQNKPNDKEAVEELLEKVDLAGLGKRKPNTLSGGQKQRVAIARALIKEPEIIMADEPTGALDSNTGKQVLDTLKKLSETKLVVVVSHDREFAELYGDRIIELKDGKILSDVSKAYSEPKNLGENVRLVSSDTISIKNAESITEADVKNIVEMLKNNGGEAIISAGKRELNDVKRACKITDSGSKTYFKETDNVAVKEYDGDDAEFIKSRLPMSHAVKMGASGLKTKPIRLIFTILLSVIAFVMFGVVSTFMLYDPDYSVSRAMQEADYPSVTVRKYYSYISRDIENNNATGEEKVQNESEQTAVTRFGEKELLDKNAAGGKFAGIFNFTNSTYGQDNVIPITLNNSGASIVPISIDSKMAGYYPVQGAYGFTDCGKAYMEQNGFVLLAGNYPESATEIAIPKYLAELFVNTDGSGIESVTAMVGKHVSFNMNAIPSNQKFKVVGVYEVGSIPQKYDTLKDVNSTDVSPQEKVELVKSLEDFIKLSFHSIIYVHEDFYDLYKGNIRNEGGYIYGEHTSGLMIETYNITDVDMPQGYGTEVYTEKTVNNNAGRFKFYNVDGTAGEFEVGQNNVYVSNRLYQDNLRRVLYNYFSRMRNMAWMTYDGQDELDGGAYFDQDIYSLDLNGVVSVVSTWYPVLAERDYVLYAAQDLKNGDLLSPQESAAYSRLWSVNGGNSAVYDGLDQDFELLKAKVDQDYHTNFKQEYYEHLFSIMVESVNNQNKNDDRAKELEEARSLPVEEWYAFIDQNFTLYTGRAIEDRFKVDLSGATIDKVYYLDYMGRSGTLEVVGYFEIVGEGWGNYLVSTEFKNAHRQVDPNYDDVSWMSVQVSDYQEPIDAKYNYIITLTDNSQEQISAILSAEDGIVYKITNDVYTQLDMFLSTINQMSKIFLILGIVIGVFAALMLLNFISVSISAKRKDIGILRAVGARGTDVFKIFFAEAFIIALICFVIAAIGAGVLCTVLNSTLVTIINAELLNYGLINVALILAVSFGISLIATFFPVYFAAKKSPVESIRAL